MAKLVAIERTTEGLRETLFREMELLHSGKIDPARTRATANLARQIIESIRVQVQFGKVLTDMEKVKLGQKQVSDLPKV